MLYYNLDHKRNNWWNKKTAHLGSAVGGGRQKMGGKWWSEGLADLEVKAAAAFANAIVEADIHLRFEFKTIAYARRR